MRITIWSNGGKHEFIISEDNEEILKRSGLIYNSRDELKPFVEELEEGE